MNPLLGIAVRFLSQRFIHFAIYGIIGVSVWGVYQKFISPSSSTKIANIEKQVNVYETPKQDLFSLGCSNLRIEAYWKKKMRNERPNKTQD